MKGGVWANFFMQQIIFRGLGLILCRKRTTSKYKKPNPTKFSANNTVLLVGWKWHFGHFFPQQTIFRGLGLILYREQSTRHPTQPNSPQTPCVLHHPPPRSLGASSMRIPLACCLLFKKFFLAFLMLTYFLFFFSSFPFSVSITWTSFVSSCLFLVGSMLSPRFRFLLRIV